MSSTFGFMDPERSALSNESIYLRIRSLAIKSFRDESVCDLSTFTTDTASQSNLVLGRDLGQMISKLRDQFYESAQMRKIHLRFPDMQAYFLYAFTMGVNRNADLLIEFDHRAEMPIVFSHDILKKHYPLQCPPWLCNAVNAEMAFVENVFCDFQNSILVPIAKTQPVNHTQLPDVVAATFLWASIGGLYWVKEVIEELCDVVLTTGGLNRITGIGAFQVKRSLELIDYRDIELVLTAGKTLEKRKQIV